MLELWVLQVMDGLVNNAGKGQSTPFMDVSEEELDTIFDINVKSIVNVSQMVVKKMIDEKISGSFPDAIDLILSTLRRTFSQLGNIASTIHLVVV